MFKLWISFFTCGVLVVLLSFSEALANESSEDLLIENKALSAALKLETAAEAPNSEIIETRESSLELKHIYSRLEILEGFDGSGNENFIDLIQNYKVFAKSSENKSDYELALFYEQLSKIYNPYAQNNIDTIELALNFLDEHILNENWSIAHSANVLGAVLMGYRRDIVRGVKFAANSLEVVPETQGLDAKVARYYSFTIIAFLHSTAKSTEMYLSSIDQVINASIKIGRPVESTNLLNNLIHAVRGIKNPEIIQQLVDILIRVGDKYPSDTPGLVEMRAANALVRIGDFNRALPIAQEGLDASENEMISKYLKIAEIQSLAAIGDTEEAQAELTAFKQSLTDNETDANFAESEVFKAKGLIAMANGDARATFTNMDRYAELSIQRLLKSNNTDTSNLLANLENDKARQAERETAREDLYRLEQDALEARIKSSQRGLVILFMLAVAAMLVAAFSAYRSRTAIKLAVAAEAALAGEKAKTQFLAVISHELRTPLNGIIGIADLLSRTAPTDDLRHKVSIINNSGQDLLRLVEQILDMSRIDANELEVFPENVDIRDVINGVDALWRPTIETKDVVFTSHVDKSVPKYLAIDPLRLRQCVNNLVSNAAKFTSQGRVHMHVIAGPSEADDTTRLKVIVADTGLGIRPDVQSNLFRPFVQADSSITRQYGGSGLGLAITRNLARLMGGDLTVTSRQGAGSEFTLTFTAKHIADTELLNTMDEIFLEIEDDISANTQHDTVLPAQAPQQTAKAPDVTKIAISPDDQDTLTEQNLAKPDFDNLSGVRILIVEDIPSNQDVMKIFLEPKGCVIMCANDGVQALKALKSQDFDVVLMDIRMPEMDGIEATRLVRNDENRNAHVPIIALTADATAETNAQCMAAGANIFLTKPIIALELYDSIRFVRRQAYNRLETKLDTQILAPAMPRRSA